MNYNIPYPMAKGVWDYFSHDVICAVDVGIDFAPIAGSKQAAFAPSTRVFRLFTDRFTIQKVAFAGIALFSGDDFNPDELRLIGQHLDEVGMRNLHKILVRASPKCDRLFPSLIFADDQHPNPHADHQLNDALTGFVQVIINPAVSFVGESLNALGGALTGW